MSLRRRSGYSRDDGQSRLRLERLRQERGHPSSRETLRDLKTRIQEQLLSDLNTTVDANDTKGVRQAIERLYTSLLAEEDMILSRNERDQLFQQIEAEILGLGPLEALLRDPEITEIMVNGPGQVFIERQGKIHKVDIAFEDEAHLRHIIDRILTPIGRRVDESSPMVNGRLLNGSRVNVIIPPLSLVGPVVTIRKFRPEPFTAQDLINNGTVTREMAEFLQACVVSRLNLIVSGGTGSGKTTTLNVLSSFLPHDERIVTIEDAAELQLQQEHVVTLEARPPNTEGKGEIRIRDLVINALRMRPDRIVVGEVRGGEALDMLQAMNTGHDGSLTTLHANSPRDVLRRLETMVLMSGMELPVRAIREQIASAMDLIVQQARLRDGSRKVTRVTEVQGMEGDTVVMQDVFVFDQEGYRDGKVIGKLRPTGVRPRFAQRIEASGIQLRPEIFGASQWTRK
jgi:pilus assembly protein CpaF